MVFIIILAAIAVVLCLYYLLGYSNENYWKKRGVTLYNGNKTFGILPEFLFSKKSMFEIHQEIYNNYANEPAIGLGSFLMPSIYVRDLKNIQHILHTDFDSFNHRGFDMYEKDFLADNVLNMTGNRWKLTRQAMSPLFTTAKLKDMYCTIDKGAEDFVTYLKTDKMKGDLQSTLSMYGSAAITAAVFGIHTKSIFDSPFLDIAIKSLEPTFARNLNLALAMLIPKAAQLFRMVIFTSQSEFFINAVKSVLRQREKENVKKHDFSDLCVILQKNGKIRDPNTGYEIVPTDEFLAAQAFFFFTAGVDPVAAAMFGVLIELGRNPEILKKMHEEIDQVWDKYNGKLSYDAVSEMEYLDKCLSEGLRKYPPIGFNTRQCIRDSVLPVGDIRISKGTFIIMPMFELHHDPKYFANPEVFDPERFANDSKSGDFSYQPFGKGGRICIGMRYGRLQAKTGLVHLLRHFNPVTTTLKDKNMFQKHNILVRPSKYNVELIRRTTI